MNRENYSLNQVVNIAKKKGMLLDYTRMVEIILKYQLFKNIFLMKI